METIWSPKQHELLPFNWIRRKKWELFKTNARNDCIIHRYYAKRESKPILPPNYVIASSSHSRGFRRTPKHLRPTV